MIAVFLQTLPFFALIGLGYGTARKGMFGPEATAALTRFVFYFALSAMLFRFSAALDLAEVLDWSLVAAYLSACTAVYVLATGVALLRGCGLAEAAVESQCAVIGNTGFLGIPMLAMLMGEPAIGPLILVLSVDFIVFSSLIVILITAAREGRMRPSVLRTVGMGLLKNPMIVSISLGLAWAGTGWTLPQPAQSFVDILGAAATPGALFAIGASLAYKSAERVEVALWLSFCKLALHPAAAAVACLLIFPIERFAASVVVAAAALPVAGNVYMLAQHYGVVPQRVAAVILVSTLFSVGTLPAVIAWLTAG